jgi:hypothetical protein
VGAPPQIPQIVPLVEPCPGDTHRVDAFTQARISPSLFATGVMATWLTALAPSSPRLPTFAQDPALVVPRFVLCFLNPRLPHAFSQHLPGYSESLPAVASGQNGVVYAAAKKESTSWADG